MSNLLGFQLNSGCIARSKGVGVILGVGEVRGGGAQGLVDKSELPGAERDELAGG